MLLFFFSLILVIPLKRANLTVTEESLLETGNFQVLRVTPENESHLKLLQKLWKSETELNLDFWKPPKGLGAQSDVMVPPSSQERVHSLLLRHQIPFEVLIPDVQKLIQQQERSESTDFNRRFQDDSSRAHFNFRKYGSFDKMVNYMEKITRQYPRIAKLITLGYTHENRSIKGVKVGRPYSRNRTKKAIWVDGGIHAREWPASHTALYFIHQLVTKYNRNNRITHFVRNLDWYIIPVLNPDGYEYSRSSSSPRVRLWRKNRSPPPESCIGQRRCCPGVDLNRNFDFHWGEKGSSTHPCSIVYAGTKAFSEPESRAVRDFVLPRARQLEAFITFHTYAQLWLYAFGHERRSYPPDVNDLDKVGQKVIKAIKRMYGTRYKAGSAADMLYPAAGGSDDWAKDKAGIKFVYLPELRPDYNGRQGFILQESQLLPTCRETFEGVAAVAEEVLQRAGKPYGERRPNPKITGTESCSDKQTYCKRWVSNNRSLCRTSTSVKIRCKKSCNFC